MLNSNFAHNVINIVMIAIAGISSVLLAIGCTQLPNGEMECTTTQYISPAVATMILTILGVVKMLINVVRDGFGGLFMPQPPVLTPAVIAEAKNTVISAKSEGLPVNTK